MDGGLTQALAKRCGAHARALLPGSSGPSAQGGHWPVMTRSGLKEAICSQVFWIHSSSIFSRAALQGQ